jgi:hypothetical protein
MPLALGASLDVFCDVQSHFWPPIQSFRKLYSFADPRVSVNRGIMMRLNDVTLIFDISRHYLSSVLVPYSVVSRFPLALSPKTKRTRSYTSCESTHVTSGVNTRQTPSNLTGIRTMETTAWQLDALSSRDRRGSGRRGLSRRSGRVDIWNLHQGR